jgi:DNA polymerase elongation subunit (family B)
LPEREEAYWICRLRKGAFPTKLKQLLAEREKYQQLVKQELANHKNGVEQKHEVINYCNARQLALKLLANAGYGAFAQKEFAYYDYRVSEIITGFGRLIHKRMEQLGFEKHAFQAVFGFTDSIFVKHNNDIQWPDKDRMDDSSIERNDNNNDNNIRQYIDRCRDELKVILEHKNRFMFTIIFDKKNRYIAWTGNTIDRPILKNLDGMNRRYPKWIIQQIEKIANHIITQPNVDVLPSLRQAFEDLDYGRIDPKDLQFTEQLDKNPRQYPNDKKLRVKVLALSLELQ